MGKGSQSNSVGENLYVTVPMDRCNDDINPLLLLGEQAPRGREMSGSGSHGQRGHQLSNLRVHRP